MTHPLLETKLHLPRSRHRLVPRARLDERLRHSEEARVTLVSAPAGFGKTTLLVAAFAAGADGRKAAWVSLDAADRQAASFWTYVVSALERAAPGSGSEALAMLESGRASVETALTTVLNELSVHAEDVYLVLDDYHLADGPGIRPGMTFLLEHLPPQVHLVISTRADPALPLARLRAQGELVEIRAADLRFTVDEVAAYLNDITGLGLPAPDIAALEARTEGWAAAVQLAALSMQGRQDVAGFIAGFAGEDRYVVDYLVEEVLDGQPLHVRSFLLETSVLDRLTGALCDAVTRQPGGTAMLASLDRSNLFVVRLDERRQWYRYHHLFADVLQAHLLEERPDHVAVLHSRASHWYEKAGQTVPAVRHALAAGDVARGADLVELAVPALRRARQEATLRTWLDDFPVDVVRRRPVLAMGFVGALMARAEYDDVEQRLRDVEGALAAPAAETVVVDEHELQRLPAAIAMYRAGLALASGDLAGTVRHAGLARTRAGDDDQLTRAGASALAGLASWAGGDLAQAHRSYSEAATGLERAGHVSDVLGCSIALADMQIAQGRLHEAMRTFEHGIQLASRHGPAVRGTADMFVGLSEVAWHRGDLAAATRHLGRSEELGEHVGLPQNAYRWRVAMARLRQAEGDLTGARQLLEEAEHVYVGDYSPNVRPVHAQRARVLAHQGDLPAARDWARRHDLSVDDELSYLHEYEHVTLARMLLTQFLVDRAEPALRAAVGLLERLLPAAQAGGRVGTVIEILVLEALARSAGGNLPAASRVLERAVSLGEPEGYAQVFVGEGPPMELLLRNLARRHPGWAYLHRLLDLLNEARQPTRSLADPQPRSANAGLVEPLSERELEVLRLLATDLDGPSIARELVVSLNTVRTHTKHIYAKLAVTNRRAAVRQAARLNLLSSAGGRSLLLRSSHPGIPASSSARR